MHCSSSEAASMLFCFSCTSRLIDFSSHSQPSTSFFVCHFDSLIALVLPASLTNISELWSSGYHYPGLLQTLDIVTLWSSRPNLRGHPSQNQPQPAHWISATRIQSHVDPSQRPFRPQSCKSEVALLAQDLPEFTHSLRPCGFADQLWWPQGTETVAPEMKWESLTDPERPASSDTWWSHDDHNCLFLGSGLENIWKTSLQAGGLSGTEEWPLNRRRGRKEMNEETDMDAHT